MNAVQSLSARYRVAWLDEHEREISHWWLGVGKHRIGRGASCSVSIDCASLSRQHAEIEIMETAGLVVLDLGSTNGSRINGEPILRCAIGGDAELQLGLVRLRLVEQRETTSCRS